MTGDVSETKQIGSQSKHVYLKEEVRIYMVRQMLIRRSQLQPVTNAAAAGGKRMAIWGEKVQFEYSDLVATEPRAQ
jgi:hypothetical protein